MCGVPAAPNRSKGEFPVKITAVLQDAMPVFDMLPAVYPADFPRERGAFKPFMHTRLAAVAGAGLYVNHAVFENPDLIPIERDERDIFQNCCASFSVNPFPQASRYYINVTCDIYGGFLATLCDEAEVIDDLTREISADFTPLTQGGYNEIGVYWGATFLLSERLFERIYGQHRLDEQSVMRGNLYICCRNPKMAHFGTVSPVQARESTSVYRTDGFCDSEFLRL